MFNPTSQTFGRISFFTAVIAAIFLTGSSVRAETFDGTDLIGPTLIEQRTVSDVVWAGLPLNHGIQIASVNILPFETLNVSLNIARYISAYPPMPLQVRDSSSCTLKSGGVIIRNNVDLILDWPVQSVYGSVTYATTNPNDDLVNPPASTYLSNTSGSILTLNNPSVSPLVLPPYTSSQGVVPTPIPEPGTLCLLGFAAAGLAFRRSKCAA